MTTPATIPPCPSCRRTNYTIRRADQCNWCEPKLLMSPPPNPNANWFQTRTGKLIDVQNPTPDMVDLEDIAHSLSMICRYAGHVFI